MLMRKITFLILSLTCTLSYSHRNKAAFENDVNVIEILDEHIESSKFFCNKEYLTPVEISFPNLKSVDGVLEFCSNSNLVHISAPALENAADKLIIQYNSDLETISFPRLKQVEKVVNISANFLIKEKLVFGTSYRWNASISGLLGFHISDTIFAGMGYDYQTTALEDYSNGSYEAFLLFEIFNRADRIVAPRFF